MFAPERTGVTSKLPELFQRFGFLNVQRRAVVSHYSADTPELEMKMFIEDMRLSFRTMLPFIRKWTRMPENYATLCQQALHEMQNPAFTAVWEMVTVWGENPQRQEKPAMIERH